MKMTEEQYQNLKVGDFIFFCSYDRNKSRQVDMDKCLVIAIPDDRSKIRIKHPGKNETEFDSDKVSIMAHYHLTGGEAAIQYALSVIPRLTDDLKKIKDLLEWSHP